MRSLFIKRLLDLLAGVTLLLLLAPVILVVALLVYLTMGQPVWFRQARAGHKGQPFTLLKFRTMRRACDSAGKPLPDRERLTCVGRFLRRTSLDELPQLFHVIRGTMSLVGPRPLLTSYLDRYSPQQARRHDVKPGLTGWTEVNGRNALGWEEKLALDVWYVDHWNLLLDLRILLATVWKVLRRDGISHAGHETMPEFMGTMAGPTDETTEPRARCA